MANAIDLNGMTSWMPQTDRNTNQVELSDHADAADLHMPTHEVYADETEKFLGKVDNKFRKRRLNETDTDNASADEAEESNQANNQSEPSNTTDGDTQVVNLKSDEGDAVKASGNEVESEDANATEPEVDSKDSNATMPEDEVAEIKMNEADNGSAGANETAIDSGDGSNAESAEQVGNKSNSTGNETAEDTGDADGTDSAKDADNATAKDSNATKDANDANDTSSADQNTTNSDGDGKPADEDATSSSSDNDTATPAPYLLSTAQKPNPHDQAALFLSKTVVDMQNSSYYKDDVQARNFETFGHKFTDGKWHFFIVEERVDTYNDTHIHMKEVVKKGEQIEVKFERMLFRGASRPKLYFPDDQITGSIVMAFENHKECNLRWSHLSLVQYANVQLMKLNIQADMINLPRTLNSTNDRKPSFFDMSWQGNIRTSKFTLVYEYETPEGEILIAKGMHSYNPMQELQWKTYPTQMHKYYENLGLEQKFSQFQKIKYKDFQYFITDAFKKNEQNGEIERVIILCKWTLIPLAVLPPVMPKDESKLRHFSSPSIRSVNDKISIFSFQAQDKSDDDKYTQFIYFTDLADYDKPAVGKWSITLVNQREKRYQPVEEKKPSVIEVVKENINRLINYVFRW